MRVFHISSKPTKEQDKECSQIRPYITVCAHISTCISYNSTSDYASHVCSILRLCLHQLNISPVCVRRPQFQLLGTDPLDAVSLRRSLL